MARILAVLAYADFLTWRRATSIGMYDDTTMSGKFRLPSLVAPAMCMGMSAAPAMH